MPKTYVAERCSGDSRNSLRVLQTNLCAPKGNSDTNMERSLLFVRSGHGCPVSFSRPNQDIHSTETTKHEE